jgi:hypothetical protein
MNLNSGGVGIFGRPYANDNASVAGSDIGMRTGATESTAKRPISMMPVFGRSGVNQSFQSDNSNARSFNTGLSGGTQTPSRPLSFMASPKSNAEFREFKRTVETVAEEDEEESVDAEDISIADLDNSVSYDAVVTADSMFEALSDQIRDAIVDESCKVIMDVRFSITIVVLLAQS